MLNHHLMFDLVCFITFDRPQVFTAQCATATLNLDLAISNHPQLATASSLLLLACLPDGLHFNDAPKSILWKPNAVATYYMIFTKLALKVPVA